MPEVAEVALTAQILKKNLKNKTLVSFDFISGPYSRKLPDQFKDFMNSLPLKIRDVNSKGKFMWFTLSNSKDGKIWYIWNSFGQSGMWSLIEPKNVRAMLTFKDGTVAYYSDSRNFGKFKFSIDEEELNKKIKKLTPDFLKDEFNLEKIKKYKIPVVKILMDQTKVGSGIGNYLVAEILYRAKLSPHKLGNQLTDKEIKNLEYWIKYVVKLAYIDNHVGYMVNLEDEANDVAREDYHPEIIPKEKTFKFLVYRKKEDPHGNEVIGEKIVGSGSNKRTTYWVPSVQK